MVTFQGGSIHDMSPLKWGTITKLGACPRGRLRNDIYCVGWGVKLYSLIRPSLKPSLNMMQLGE